jgi:hypothetical protein
MNTRAPLSADLQVSTPIICGRAPQRGFQCALGVIMAALLFDALLRPFVADSNHLGVRTIRNYFEGLSTAHFEDDGLGEVGNRLTGNSWLSGAPEGMIIGDSHVVAYAVRDEETMGAMVERLSRAAGQRLNVRQYGWHGANAATFLASSESLLRTRNPAWVAVVLNSYNVGVNALASSGGWHMEVAPDYSFRLIDDRLLAHQGLWRKLWRLAGYSVLVRGLGRRWGLFESRLVHESYAQEVAGENHRYHRSSWNEEASRVPRATVLGLKSTFGKRLLIVYAPQLLGTGHYSLEPVEMEVQRLCAQESVAFLSVREALERDRNEHSRLSRGFSNTAPGVGHFNAFGHRVIGEEIWRYLYTRSSTLIGSS